MAVRGSSWVARAVLSSTRSVLKTDHQDNRHQEDCERPEPLPNLPFRKRRGEKSHPLVLTSERRWESPNVGCRQRRNGLPDPHPAGLEAHQPRPGQFGEMQRLPHGKLAARGGDQPQEISHRPGAQHGGPKASDVRMVGGVAGELRIGPQGRREDRPAPHRRR